jgi:hypothetical protein
MIWLMFNATRGWNKKYLFLALLLTFLFSPLVYFLFLHGCILACHVCRSQISTRNYDPICLEDIGKLDEGWFFEDDPQVLIVK